MVLGALPIHPSPEKLAEKKSDRRIPIYLSVFCVLTLFLFNVLIFSYAMYIASTRVESIATIAEASTGSIGGEKIVAPAVVRSKDEITSDDLPTTSDDYDEDDWVLEELKVVNIPDLPPQELVRTRFLQHCAGCHGEKGLGDGPAADYILPPPRNFVDSTFRYSSPWEDHNHTLGDLERTIRLGVPRSAMPGFYGVLTESEIAGLAGYVLALREQGEPAYPGDGIVDVGKRPPLTPELVVQGKELYTSLACNTCHGDSGLGDGMNATALVDFQGRPVRPADFTSGLFKTGQTPEDLCLTILRGVPGTPMVAYEAAVTQENDDETLNIMDAWALVAFIRNLAPHVPPAGEASGADIIAQYAADEAMLDDPTHIGWLGVQPTLLRIKPLKTSPETTTKVEVRVVKNGERIAICLDWLDETLDASLKGNSVSDGATLTFGLTDVIPPLPLGIELDNHPSTDLVNIWRWSAGMHLSSLVLMGNPLIQSDSEHWYLFVSDSRARLPELSDFDSMIDSESNAMDIAPPRPAYEANAIGLQSSTDQSNEMQQLRTSAAWTGGKWRVIFVRHFETRDKNDVQFTTEQRIPVSFIISNGTKDREEQSPTNLISGWHWIVFKP